MTPPADPSQRLALSRIPFESLSPRVRRVLDGVDDLLVYSAPMSVRFRRVTSRDGLLLHGVSAWGEASPFWDYAARESSAWLASALGAAMTPAPPAKRSQVPVNVTIPVVSPEDAYRRVLASGGCATAKVKVADPGAGPADDCARVEAVAQALADTVGSSGAVRVDANGAWDEDEAVRAIRALDEAASSVGGLQYAEQPCPSVDELARVRRRVDVPIAADESIRRAEDPLAVARACAADIAVIKIAPLGGIDRALSIARDTGLRLVVSSALETSIGLATGVSAAAALDDVLACGLATSRFLAADVTADRLTPVNGHLPLRAIAPDADLIDQHPVDEDLRRRWTVRLEDMCAHIEGAR